MKAIPRTQNAPVLRVDFSDDEAWNAVCALLVQPSTPDGFMANLEFVNDRAFETATVPDILASLPEAANGDVVLTFIFVVDDVAISNPEHPVLVVDLYEEPGRTFRAIPSEAWGVENNLSLANMDFEEFADSADSDGVFRGFLG